MSKRSEYTKNRMLKKKKQLKREIEKSLRPVRFSLYIDESGNSGLELFNSSEDYFILTGMLVKSGVEIPKEVLDRVKLAAGPVGLHGSKLGLTKLEPLADDIVSIIKEIDAYFVVSLIEKKYYCAMKLWDCIFDAGTNPGVTGLHVTMAPLRFIGMAKFCGVISVDLLKEYWELYRSNNVEKFKIFLPKLQEEITASQLDARSKEIVGDAIRGALLKPEQVLGNGVIKEDSPNVSAVVMMSHELNKISPGDNVVIDQITHDRQKEFKENIEMMFNAMRQTKIVWGLRDIYPKNEKSKIFQGKLIVDETPNDFLDIVDIVCYMIKKMKDVDLKGASERLGAEIWNRMSPLRMNQAGIQERAEWYHDQVMKMPMDEEKITKGKEFYKMLDKKRQSRLISGEVEWTGISG